MKDILKAFLLMAYGQEASEALSIEEMFISPFGTQEKQLHLA